jgi:hypothetical protein
VGFSTPFVARKITQEPTKVAKDQSTEESSKRRGFFNAFGNVPASRGFLHKALKKPTPLKMVGILQEACGFGETTQKFKKNLRYL